MWRYVKIVRFRKLYADYILMKILRHDTLLTLRPSIGSAMHLLSESFSYILRSYIQYQWLSNIYDVFMRGFRKVYDCQSFRLTTLWSQLCARSVGNPTWNHMSWSNSWRLGTFGTFVWAFGMFDIWLYISLHVLCHSFTCSSCSSCSLLCLWTKTWNFSKNAGLPHWFHHRWPTTRIQHRWLLSCLCCTWMDLWSTTSAIYPCLWSWCNGSGCFQHDWKDCQSSQGWSCCVSAVVFVNGLSVETYWNIQWPSAALKIFNKWKWELGFHTYFTLHPSFIHQNRQSAFDSSCAGFHPFSGCLFCCRPWTPPCGAFEAGNDGSCRRQCILFAGDQSWQDECNWHIVTLGKASSNMFVFSKVTALEVP